MATSKSSKLENVITGITGGIQLATVIEGNVVPVVVGIVKGIKAKMQGQVIEYTVVLTVGQQENDDAQNNYQASLDAINAERAKSGLPPIVSGT